MKKVVWENKSNSQLCVTVPKDSDIKEGDLVEIKKAPIRKIAYSAVVADLFHYGHLYSIQFAKSISDYNICGIISDKAVEDYRLKPIANLKERKAIVSSLKCVDRVIVQNNKNPIENLKKIHEEFPDAEIILVHGSDLKYVHGSEYVKKIGGKVVQHPYYERLSTFKIINKIIENKDKFKDIIHFTSLIKDKDKLGAKKWNKVIISTKANTLKAFQSLLKKSIIEKMFVFTAADWKNEKNIILNKIKEKFENKKIVVRSSAIKEDTLNESMAGCFESVLNVDSNNSKEIEGSIKKVIKSYKEKKSESSLNQILIQTQTEGIVMSGVVFTRSLSKNGPYYVINYDDSTGETDTVTKGIENKTIIISRFINKYPKRFKRLMEAVREIEENLLDIPLDIEFAISKKGDIIIFQIRPIAANMNKQDNDDEIKRRINELKNKYQNLIKKPEHLEGDITYFADMPDWNPAEIIGDNPNSLDFSLYDYIITDSAWHEARKTQGYWDVNPAKLVVSFGNKPYVNVRNSFNSFIPKQIPAPLRKKLVSFYLNKLKNNPELQDKVEFDIVYTCYDLSFDKKCKELAEFGLSDEEIHTLKKGLIDLTNNLIVNSRNVIGTDMGSVISMGSKREEINRKIKKEDCSIKELIDHSKELLDDCKEKGTIQFSRLARLAFVAKRILKSLVENKVINKEFYDQLLNSISTVATQLSEDFKNLTVGGITKEEFIKKYYHLRPGTYDITSRRYDANPELFSIVEHNKKTDKDLKPDFELDKESEKRITQVLKEHGLNFDAGMLIKFVKESIESRELSKFEFTKNLSDAIELIAEAGKRLGFKRNELALVDINTIFSINSTVEDFQEMAGLLKKAIKFKIEEREINNKMILPPIIFSEHDFDIIKYYNAKPNFITENDIEEEILVLNDITDVKEMENKIVVLENGDPGYDWIFTKNPSGLITKYGGVASHMAIRCAEFGIPAAIGCGEEIFNRVINSRRIKLNCKSKKLEAI